MNKVTIIEDGAADNSTVAPMRLLTPEDYLEAAKLLARCERDRLPLIAGMLEK